MHNAMEPKAGYLHLGSQFGLRERKKMAMREKIAQTALEMVSQRGIHAVTVEEIAEAAGISRRTFHNYFSTKNDALAYYPENWPTHFSTILRSRPARESAFEALSHTIGQVIELASPSLAQWSARERLAREHPEIASYYIVQIAKLEEQLCEDIMPRLQNDLNPVLTARVLVGSVMAATRVAALSWLNSRESSNLREMVDHYLNRLGRGMTDW